MRVALVVLLGLVMSGCALTRKDAEEPVENRGVRQGTAEEVLKPSEVLKPRSRDIASPSTDRFYMRGIYFPASVETQIQLDSATGAPGTLLSAEEDLGLDDKVDLARMDFNIRMGRRHNVHVDFFKLNRFSQQPLPRDIEFGNFIFEEGTDFRTKLDWRVLTLTHSYSFIQNDRIEAGIGLGIHLIEAHAEGLEPGTNNREAAEEVGIFPTINGIFSWQMSKRFAITARALWFSAAPEEFDGTMSEYHMDIQYRAANNMAIGLGYTMMKTELQVFDTDDPLLFNMDTSGPELFIRFSF